MSEIYKANTNTSTSIFKELDICVENYFILGALDIVL